MKASGKSSEEFFLKIFKVIVLVILSLALVVTAGALAVSAFQYFQTPKPPNPAQKAPEKSVDVNEFLKQFKQDAQPKQEQVEEKKLESEQSSKPEPIKYREEAAKIMACAKDSNAKSGRDASNFTKDGTENFRKEIQRIADFKGTDRGQLYITDAVRVVCALLIHNDVISFKKANPDAQLFGPIVNYHIKKWDELRVEAKRFEREEQERVRSEERDEDMRVAASKARAFEALTIAAGAFFLFMATALYLIFAAIESNLRNINRNIEAARNEKLDWTEDKQIST